MYFGATEPCWSAGKYRVAVTVLPETREVRTWKSQIVFYDLFSRRKETYRCTDDVLIWIRSVYEAHRGYYEEVHVDGLSERIRDSK